MAESAKRGAKKPVGAAVAEATGKRRGGGRPSDALGGGQAIGGPETVRSRLDDLAARTGADELMLTTMVHGHADRIRSYEIVAELYELPGVALSGETRAG